MAYFPLFINIEGRLCVVVGGGGVGARKAETLLGFGALVRVIDPAPCAEIERLAEEKPGALTLLRRGYRGRGDLRGAALAIAASSDSTLNRAVSRDAGRLGVPFNAADDREMSGFIFPAIIRRGDLVAAVSSSGVCPRFAARVRDTLEASWPAGWAEALRALGEERARLRAAALPAAEALPLLDKMITLMLEGAPSSGARR